MRILVIGGSGFIGSFVCRDLADQGHEVTVFHRGSSTARLPSEIRHIQGDRGALAAHRGEFERLAPDVVLDCILSSGAQAQLLMDTLRGITGRIVALSSADVYRTHGILHGFDTGPLQPIPITEESDLRPHLHPYRPEALQGLWHVFPWVDDDYDKIPSSGPSSAMRACRERSSGYPWSTVPATPCIACSLY